MKYHFAFIVAALLIGLSVSEAYADNVTSNSTDKAAKNVTIKRTNPYSFCTEKSTVRFYEEANFSGGCKAFKNGEDKPHLSKVRYFKSTTNLNDTISSVKIRPGFYIILYEKDNYKGRSINITSDTTDLGNFDDVASSIRIKKIRTARSAKNMTSNTTNATA